jgi:hypothetical protein
LAGHFNPNGLSLDRPATDAATDFASVKGGHGKSGGKSAGLWGSSAEIHRDLRSGLQQI